MLAYPFEEKRLATWSPPYLVQPKLDGERCRAVFSGEDNRGYLLVSSEQHEILSVPHLNAALNNWHFSTGRNDELDGELYCHGLSFEQIHSRVGRTANYHEDFAAIEFHMFDVVSDDPQFKRTADMMKLKPLPQFCRFVRTELASSLDDIFHWYNEFLTDGYEGIVVRSISAPYVRKRSTQLMKFKPKKSDWYRVVGVQEEISKDGEPKGTLGALICSGDDGTRFSVGSGLTAAQRKDLWAQKHELFMADHFCHVQYQHITPGKKVPRFPVFVEVLKGGL
jgi:DNA ligase-1